MERRIALCIDELTCQNPDAIGLEGEQLDSQTWLKVFSSGTEVRREIGEGAGLSEAWVVSCDDVEPINLAASLKSDRPGLRVCLVTFDACGSLLSRAHTAGIDEVLEQGTFLRRYVDTKRRMLEGPGLDGAGFGAPGAGGVGGNGGLSVQPGQAPQAQRQTAELLPAPALEAKRTVPSVARFFQLQPQPASLPAHAGGRGFMLTVVSGSGGAGKSAVSALGALIARDMGHRTLLIDCDLQFGDVAEMVGVDDPLCIDTALAHPDQLERELANCGQFLVLAPPARLEAAEEVVGKLPALIDRLSGEFDAIVANTGSTWAEQHAALLERSSAALFIVDQRVSSVRACKHALELCARCGIATGPFQFALNRCAKGAPLSSIDVSCALQGAPVFELKEGGRDVEDYLSSGAAGELFETRNEFAKSLEQVMVRLLPGGNHRAIERDPSEPERRPRRRRGRHADRKRGRK